MAFLKWKHCYRDIWEASSWFHRQHPFKYALLQSGTWSWESVGCFFMSCALLCLCESHDEGKHSNPLRAIGHNLGHIHKTISLQEVLRLEGWDIQVLMKHFMSQHLLHWRAVSLTKKAQKTNYQHPSLRCNYYILIKLETLTFQALHIIFITALLPVTRKPWNYRISWIWNTK